MLHKPFRGQFPNRLHPIQRGLVGFWAFNEGTGNQVFNFQDPQHPGTLENGTAWVPGKSGIGSGHDLFFDGFNDYILLPNTITLSGDLTVIARANVPDFVSGDAAIVLVGNTDNSNWIRFNSATVLSFIASDELDNITHGLTIPVNEPIHLAIVRKSTTVTFYLNGVAGGTTGVNSGALVLSAIARKAGITYLWHGNMNHVRIYNRALSGQEISILNRDSFPEWD